MKRLSVLLSALVLSGVLLSACGNSVANDPASVVQGMFQALQTKNISAMQSLACAEERDQIANKFNPAGSVTGVTDSQKALDAVSIAITNLTVAKTSESGDHAVVNVKGIMTMTIDRDKLAAMMKSGGADDAKIANSLDLMQTMFGAGLPMDYEVDVIKENGKWVFCD